MEVVFAIFFVIMGAGSSTLLKDPDNPSQSQCLDSYEYEICIENNRKASYQYGKYMQRPWNRNHSGANTCSRVYGTQLQNYYSKIESC